MSYGKFSVISPKLLAMNKVERDYKALVEHILTNGTDKEGRNGTTRSTFGQALSFNLKDGFPLLTGRKMFYKGVLGELAAMLRGPKSLADFEKFGCNYWADWAKEDGSINVDYGNTWIDFNGVNQLEQVLETLKTNPNDRRMIISGWKPNNIANLDLPCCHLLYQWYVSNGELQMMWYQRSADLMIGVPADIILAAAWNIAMASEVGLVPGKVTMIFGDTHIYEEHYEKAEEYLNRPIHPLPKWKTRSLKVSEFVPADIHIYDYIHEEPIKFELKA